MVRTVKRRIGPHKVGGGLLTYRFLSEHTAASQYKSVSGLSDAQAGGREGDGESDMHPQVLPLK